MILETQNRDIVGGRPLNEKKAQKGGSGQGGGSRRANN